MGFFKSLTKMAFDPMNISGAFSKKSPTGAINTSTGATSKQVQQDFRSGADFGKELVGDGSLGRVGSNSDIQAVLEQRRAQAQGLTGAEMQGQRDQASQQINIQTEQARRRLGAAQARSGVRGATAGTQQANIIAQGNMNQANLQRDLMLRNREAQIAGTNALEASAGGVAKFDLGQAAKEKFGQLSTGLGMAQIGATERGSIAAANAVRATAAAGGGGKK